MAHDNNTKFAAQPQKDEAIFVLRMVGVEEDDSTLIVKCRLGFVE